MADVPQTIGKYQIQGVLGKGAMGLVYKGLDPGIGRSVALKVIHEHLLLGEAGQEIVTRFQREAQAAGRLIHNHIVSIFEYGMEGNIPFIAMELVEGSDLKELLKAHLPFSLEQTVSIVGQLLDALGYAHSHGVVHRDIKPANIVRLDGGLVKVMDFGIARLEASTLTQTGAMMGSPSYMSPEQVMGQKADARSDLFSAGVVLFELLTGEKPFHAHGATAVLHKILNDPAPEPSAYNPMVPPQFNGVIKKALAKRADDRYQTAGQFREALFKALQGLEEPAAPPEQETVAPGEVPQATLIPTPAQPGTLIPTVAGRATATPTDPKLVRPMGVAPPGVTAMGGQGSARTGLGERTQGAASQWQGTMGGSLYALRRGPVFIPIPVSDLPTSGISGVDLYLTFKDNFVLFRGRNLEMDQAVRDQWVESGIERVFIREDDFADYLAWVYRGAGGGPAGGPVNIQSHFIQAHFYPVDGATFGQGTTPAFIVFAYKGGRFFPLLGPEVPNLPTVVDLKVLLDHPQLYIHLDDLKGYYRYLDQLMGKESKLFPLNRKGAALTREKVRLAAHELFHSPKVGEALVSAKSLVVGTLDVIVGNPDTYYAMLAVSDLDSNTYIHSANVAIMSVGLGYALGLRRGQLLHLGLGGLLHDIGKREIRDDLLFKRGGITVQEYETLKDHVLQGERFCQERHGIPDAVIRIVAQHHERLDGSGYPRGLRGDEIDPLAQVVAIIEIYDALTSNQPFRKALTPFKALRKLRRFGDALNQEMVSRFIQQLGMQVAQLDQE